MEAAKQPQQVIASLVNPGTEVYQLMIHPSGSASISIGLRDEGYPWGSKDQTQVLEELCEEIKACGFEFLTHSTWVETPEGYKSYSIEEWSALDDEERLTMDITRWCSYYEKHTEMTCVYLWVMWNNLDRPNKKGGE